MGGVGGEEDSTYAEGGRASLVDPVRSNVEEFVGARFGIARKHAFVFGGLVGDYLFWGEGCVFAVGDTPEAVRGDFCGPGCDMLAFEFRYVSFAPDWIMEEVGNLHVVVYRVDYEVDIIVAKFLEWVVDLSSVSLAFLRTRILKGQRTFVATICASHVFPGNSFPKSVLLT